VKYTETGKGRRDVIFDRGRLKFVLITPKNIKVIVIKLSDN